MLNIINWPRVRAEKFHNFLPEEIRSYLKGRGIPATIIERHLLGWNGERITIPIFGPNRQVLGFRYAKSPTDISDSPEVISDPKLGAQLYGAEALARKPYRVVICDGEFNRLVLETNDFTAVTSTSGAEVFPKEWLPYFESVKHVYVCFNRDRAGEAAARKVQAILPRARIVKLPACALDVTDFFVFQEKTKLDFEILLASAPSDENDPSDTPPTVREFRPLLKSVRRRAEGLRKDVKLHELVEQYATLQARGKRLVAHCPFHGDRELSFCVYPETNTYACSGCGARGDVVQFLMDKESMTFSEALDALERFEFTHEIYGTG
ncbi:MAG TPA: CHC2 zinc finger domain-containing protein [Thermoanaerobaculia bacterium]|nr:CHC2 zinc finger domain-containing protein [Thermoanaerobaculia bacterium]